MPGVLKLFSAPRRPGDGPQKLWKLEGKHPRPSPRQSTLAPLRGARHRGSRPPRPPSPVRPQMAWSLPSE